MTTLEEEDEEAGTELLKERFGAYVKAGISADDLEDLYLSVHKAIREDPSPLHKDNKKTRVKSMTFDNKYKNQQKISYEERKAKVAAKLAAMEEDSDSDEE